MARDRWITSAARLEHRNGTALLRGFCMVCATFTTVHAQNEQAVAVHSRCPSGYCGFSDPSSMEHTCTYFEIQEVYSPDYIDNDDFGTSVGVEGDMVAIAAPQHKSYDGTTLIGPGAIYIYRRVDVGVPGDHGDDQWEFEQKLEPWDRDNFSGSLGDRIDISGDRLVADRQGDANGFQGWDPEYSFWDDTGSVYVFRYDGTQWVPEQKLMAPDAAPHQENRRGPRFGYDVSISGKWIAVGQIETSRGNDHITGNVYVFRLEDQGTPEAEDDVWVGHTKFAHPVGQDSDRFGDKVALRGDRLVVGAVSWYTNSTTHDDGTAYVYRRDDAGTPDDLSDDQWILHGRLSPSDDQEISGGTAFRYFPVALGLWDQRVVAGAPLDWPYGAGFVFRLDDLGPTPSPLGHIWHEEVKLVPSDGDPLNGIGNDVAIVGDRICLGDATASHIFTSNRPGAAYGYRLVGGKWVEQQKLSATDPTFEQELGAEVAIADGQIIVGAPGDRDNGWESGSVYVFRIVDDCDRDCVRDEQEIAAGTSIDCDGNGIPDECEDCDGNGLANACDIANCPPGDVACADCNHNGLPDGCEVAGYFDGPAPYVGPGTSRRDCNGNGVPDECDLVNCPPGNPACADCNGNHRPDGCDRDCNGDGVPDDCVSICTDDCECWDGWECTRGRCIAGACAQEPARAGDADLNGYIGLADIFCVLKGFSGSSPCPFDLIDIVPCGGNGAITIFDVFAVLDAYRGVDPCCGG